MEPLGLYIHIPFCLSKCPYCDFYSLTFTQKQADAYIKALCRALSLAPRRGQPVNSLSFWGRKVWAPSLGQFSKISPFP